MGRNKKCISVDMNKSEGRELIKKLSKQADVLVENFRPGKMEEWELGPKELKAENPELVYSRISGYGQTGPYSPRPGYASVCEAVGGFRYINGFPDRPPVRPNISLGDTLAALHAVLGIIMSLVARDGGRNRMQAGKGQVVDVAIFESVFNMMESIVPEYDRNGTVRQPSGSTLTGITPTNTYVCGDGKYVVIGGNGDSIFKRLMAVVGWEEERINDPKFANNNTRNQNEVEIDSAITAWTSSLDSEEVLHLLEEARVPSGPIYSVVEMAKDEHFKARGLFEQVQTPDGQPLQIPAITPKLVDTPGGTDWPGGAIGSHTREVLVDILGLSEHEVTDMKAKGTIQ
mmetsp:Transcript_31468/g.61385  ORF Transcript_31468/g.61385 Transcript_31468/m.61385 type:complete len:344 (-) Transcript_31468:2002-3033(-)